MKQSGEIQPMEKLPILSLCYTATVAYFTVITPQDFELYAKIGMYLSATLLSLISAFYVYKNKGRKK